MGISMDLAVFYGCAFSADLLPVHFCVELSESAEEIPHIRPWGVTMVGIIPGCIVAMNAAR